MTHRRIGVDLDGVCAMFNQSFAEILRGNNNGKDLLPKDWKDESPFICWNWPQYYYPREVVTAAWKEVREAPLFWATLDPYDGVEECLHKLGLQVVFGNIDLYFITARRGKGIKMASEQWILKHSMQDIMKFTPTVLVVDESSDKIPIIKSLGLDFFIDDNLETVDTLSRGTRSIRAYLRDAPWNRDIRFEGIKVVSDLRTALKAEGII